MVEKNYICRSLEVHYSAITLKLSEKKKRTSYGFKVT